MHNICWQNKHPIKLVILPMQLRALTKCCGADAHADCFDNYSLKKCVICQTQRDTERNPIFGERGGSDYVYSTRALYLNEKHRREGTHYFTRPDWTTGSIIDYSMPYRQ